MTAKQELMKYINTITEDDARVLIPLIRKLAWLAIPEGEAMTEEEAAAFARKEYEKGEYITLEEFEVEYNET